VAQRAIGIVFAGTAALHQDPLRALDQLAVGQRVARLRKLGLELLKGAKARDRHLQHRAHALGAGAL